MKTSAISDVRKRWVWLICALPLLGLLPLHAQFYLDWPNHIWSIDYTAWFIRHYGALPEYYNMLTGEGPGRTVIRNIGSANPNFYGYWLFPVLGFFAQYVNSHIVIRCAVFGVMLLQYYSVFVMLSGTRRLSRPIQLATALATVWATYPLTNLYNRSAVPEFFATALLTAGISFSLSSFQEGLARQTRSRRVFASMLLLTLAAGTHPITAVYSSFIFGFLAIVIWKERLISREVWREFPSGVFVLSVLLAGLSLASFGYATIKLSSGLVIASNSPPGPNRDTFDNFLTRFFPIPFDSRMMKGGMEISTPHLDAQMSIPLLILALFLGWTWSKARGNRNINSEKRLSVVSVMVWFAVFGLLTSISLVPGTLAHLPSIFWKIQWVYRTTAFLNLMALFAVWMFAQDAGVRESLETRAARSKIVASSVVTLAGVALVMKVLHALPVRTMDGERGIWRSEDKFNSILSQDRNRCPSYWEYALRDRYPQLKDSEEKSTRILEPWVGVGQQTGESRPLSFDIEKPGWVVTRISVFPWNQVWLDGRKVEEHELRMYVPTGNQFAVYVGAGHHVLEHRWAPDPVWSVLNWISRTMPLAWGVLFLSIWLAPQFAWRTGSRMKVSNA